MKNVRRGAAASLLAIALSGLSAPVAAETGFYQYPEVHGDTLVFASEGDLWRASRSGGDAIRLTNHVEEEANPRISPDGTMVAFTAGYDSLGDIYVMPLAGGAPKRLTFLGGLVKTVGWTPDGKVIFMSRRERGLFGEVLFTVDPAGGDPVAIPLFRATDGVVGSDGQTLFFTRRGIASSGDNAAQYRGGNMGQLWRWQMGSDAEAVRMLADFDGPVGTLMRADGRIWFVSDKTGGDAVWSVAEDGSDLRQDTPQMPFPIRQAAVSGGQVFMQNGADIQVFSLADKSMHGLPLAIVSDREQTRQRSIEKPLKYLTDATVAPSGQSVAVTARGRVALGFPKDRRRIELPVPLDARARQARLSPDGKTVYLLLDRDLSGGIYKMPADGSGPPVAVSKSYASHIWDFVLSPDGKTIVFTDKAARLQKLEIASGALTQLAQSRAGDDYAFRWVTFSPDNRFIAYAEPEVTVSGGRGRIWLQRLADGSRSAASSTKYDDRAPAFSRDGKWLYFLSDRNFDPEPGSAWGDRNMGVAFPEREEIYAVQLDPAADFPFSDSTELTGSGAAEPAQGDPEAKDEKSKAKGKDAPAKPVNVAMEGLSGRLWKVPGAKGVTGMLYASEGFLYAGRGDDEVVSIAISKTDPEIETFAKGAQGFELSADGKTAFIVTGAPGNQTLALVPAAAKMPDKLDDARIRLSDWRLQVDPRAEWHQMFLDAWRLHRDFAYDPKLRGVDWDAVRSRLEPLVERIGHRAELNAVLSQMSWNLGILHSQIAAGDVPTDSENAEMGYLGAVLVPAVGGMRIAEVDDSDPDLVASLPPLRRPGVGVREGDVITRIDGLAVASQADVATALVGKVGQEVRLDLTRGGAARSAIVKPIGLRPALESMRNDRVFETRAALDRATGGRIGYVSLAAMGAGDVAEFARDFYAQSEKPGMIIDVRNNDGGNVDSIIIGALLRKVWAYWSDPTGGPPQTNMQGAYRGHVAVLADEMTYSDGETFAAGIRSLGLAPVIGQRTAGAGIWLSDRNSLTDNGRARVAEYAQHRIDGQWLIEGWGVEPDIAVDNMPHAAFKGADAQLQAAINWLDDRIAAEPVRPLVPAPLPPVGTPGVSAIRE